MHTYIHTYIHMRLMKYALNDLSNFQTWRDEFLTWNETETGIKRLAIPVDEIWKPDLCISNL